MVKEEAGPQLVRGLGLLDCILLVMGTIIGSGIFLTTGIMALDLPSPLLLLLVWGVGGLLSLAGALTYAELGAAMPEAGGPYIYLREAYGPLPAFLFGWISFLVYQTGSIAAVAVGFAEYLGYFAPALGTGNILASAELFGHSVRLSAGQISASAAIVLLTLVNVFGLRAGSYVQNLFTFLKIAAIAGFVLFGFLLGRGSGVDLGLQAAGLETSSLLTGFGVALIAVLWTFSGWDNLSFSAGEIKEPARNFPRGLLLGTVAVTLVYLLTNAAYIHALPVPEMQGVTRVAEKAAQALFGPEVTALIAAAVVVSTFGCANGLILTAARAYYAMAKDGLFFRPVARVHPRFRTPHISLWLQCGWGCLLTLSGTYDQLFTYVIFAGLLIWGAAVASVFTLRRKQPDLSRPYRVWGYPVVPVLFLAALAAIMINTLLERPIESLSGVGFLILGLPAYAFWSRSRGKRGS